MGGVRGELADAADVLSDQLRVHLQRLAVCLLPHAEALERKFVARLKRLGFEPKLRGALTSLTPGAAAFILGSGRPPLKFIEQVEYNGRRLAKLNISPSAIIEALQEYDNLLTPTLKRLLPREHAPRSSRPPPRLRISWCRAVMRASRLNLPCARKWAASK